MVVIKTHEIASFIQIFFTFKNVRAVALSISLVYLNLFLVLSNWGRATFNNCIYMTMVG